MSTKIYCVTGSLEKICQMEAIRYISAYMNLYPRHVYCSIGIKSDIRNLNIILFESTGFMKLMWKESYFPYQCK